MQKSSIKKLLISLVFLVAVVAVSFTAFSMSKKNQEPDKSHIASFAKVGIDFTDSEELSDTDKEQALEKCNSRHPQFTKGDVQIVKGRIKNHPVRVEGKHPDNMLVWVVTYKNAYFEMPGGGIGSGGETPKPQIYHEINFVLDANTGEELYFFSKE